MRVFVACFLLVCSGCVGTRATAPAGAATDVAAREVIQTTERLFRAMEARDTTTLQALFHPDARVIGIAPDGRVRAQGVAEWVRGVGRSAEALRERIWDPRVEVSGELATLWAPYDFHIGERFSHCGMDAFQFVREELRWRLLVVTFTREPEGCEGAPGSRR